MWRTNTVTNTGDCLSINPKEMQATTPSPQRLLVLVNHLSIHTICPAIMMNTQHVKMWLRWHLDTEIVQHAYWHPQGYIWIHRLKHQSIGGKSIQIVMTTTPTLLRLAVHFGCPISLTGGTSKKKHTQGTPICPMWHATYSLSYHMVLGWRLVVPLGETLSDGGSQKP